MTELFQRAGFQGAWPLNAVTGLESMFIYNGLVLNDRRYPDVYRLTDVTGIDDADIVDSRENIPASHGESDFPAFYGGRTITLTGRIEAGNMNKLRLMEQNLRTAFANISDLPLYIRSGVGVNDNFSTDTISPGPGPNANYFFDTTKSEVTVSGGQLAFTNAATQKRFFRQDAPLDNGTIQAKFTSPSTLPAGTNRYGIVIKRNDFGACLVWFFDFKSGAGNGRVVIGMVDAAGTVTESVVAVISGITWTASTNYWLVAKLTNYSLFVEYWTAQPSLFGNNPAGNTLTIPDITSINGIIGSGITHGPTVKGYAGFFINPAAGSTLGNADDLIIEPYGVLINCRKSQPVNIKQAKDNNFFTSDFQITLRAPDPRFYSTTLQGRQVTLVNAAFATVVVPSNGNFFSQPVIRLGNAGTSINSPTVVNATRAETSSFTGAISTGTSIYFEWQTDIQSRYLRDQTGTSKWSFLNAGGQFPLIQPGNNLFAIANTSIGGSPTAQIEWRDAWI